LIAEPKSFLGKTVEIQGKIADQCKTMGCYFFFRSGHDTLRVDLQEVAMTAPMMDGRTARVEGNWCLTTTDISFMQAQSNSNEAL